MNVSLTNDEYAKLGEIARERGELVVDTAASIIRESL